MGVVVNGQAGEYLRYVLLLHISGTDRADARDRASAELRRVADEGTKEESR